MICEKCKSNIPDAVKFCPKCGAKVELGEKRTAVENQKDVILCPKCGSSYPLTAKFCRKDGTPLQKVPPSAVDITPPKIPEKEIKLEEIKPEIEATSAEVIGEKIKADVEKPKDVIICPKCGTPNLSTAKFCKKDGTLLKQENKSFETKKEDVKSEMVIETKPEEVPIEIRPEEKISKIEEQKDTVICPKCGTPNSSTAKFCKKDGAPLKAELKKPLIKEEIKKPSVVEAEMKIEEVKKPSRKWIWITAIFLIFVIAGAGSYLYFTGFFGKNPAKMQEVINTELKSKGMLNVFAEINQDWIATVKGSVSNQSYKDNALSIVKQHKEIKSVIDNIQIQSPLSDIERNINNALRGEGLINIYAQVDNDSIATLRGPANSQDEKDRAINIVRMNREIKDVRDEIQLAMVQPPSETVPPQAPARVTKPSSVTLPSSQSEVPPLRANPYLLEKEVNQALRNAGLRSVAAEIGDDLNLTLRGSVHSAEEKEKAFAIAKTSLSKGVKNIKDVIFVINY